MSVIHITVSDGKHLADKLEKKSNGKLCVVMFTASWCGPCKNIKKEIEGTHGLAELYKDKVQFFYVDIDDNPSLATEYTITSIPVFYFMICKKNGIEFACNKMKGGNKATLVESITEALDS